MINGKFILFVLTAFISFAACKKEISTSSVGADLKNEFIVIVDPEFPGHFNFDNKNFGYSYDLLKVYSEHIGVPIRVQYSENPTKTLAEGGGDMVLSISDHSIEEPNSIELFETSYVVLTSKRQFRGDGYKFSIENLTSGDNVKVLASADFKLSHDYDKLLDKGSGSHLFIDHRDPLKQAQSLEIGGYDYMICEKSEAQLIMALIKNVRKIFEFDSKNQINVTLADRDTQGIIGFNQWLSEYKSDDAYSSLEYLYMETGYAGSHLYDEIVGVTQKISMYDDEMEAIALEYGYDWKLLAAMAYSESRFNPHVISNMGAKGLMQIMPIVARQFKVNPDKVMDIDTNIMLAVKLLDKMDEMLKFPSTTSESDRLKILMAGYNAGVGHVLDAMRLAKKYGDDPNSWSDISYYLKNKIVGKYANDDVVKSGAFRGSKETLAYVDKVYDKYNQYCGEVTY